ncbi:MAG: hypothetical protein R3C31_02040 [Hyphomonadaceae bacterium]
MKTARGSFFGIAIIAVFFVLAIVMLVPGFATIVGGLIANLWVTVMGAVAGILGGLIGS